MQAARLMQPGKEGLVIATNSNYGVGKLFLWYYDRPRKFYKGGSVHKLTYHDGNLLGMQDIHKNYSYQYTLNDILGERVILDKRFDCLYSDGERLYGTREAEEKECINVNEGCSFYSYKPIEIGRIFDSKFETDFMRHMFVVSLAGEGENVFLSERKFPRDRWRGEKGARCVKISGEKEETLLDLGECAAPYCVLPTDKGLLAGVDFGIWNVSNNKPVKHFSEAHEYFNKLRIIWDYKLDSCGIELIKETQKFLKDRSIPILRVSSERIDECLYQTLHYEFEVRYMVEFQDGLVYATNHQLYTSGSENPVWNFKDYIVGLARVDSEDLLGKVKGETSVRGAKNAEVVSLLAKIGLAA